MENNQQSEKSSYRQIMQVTSIFGGVQVFQIIINIVRSKIIAILLGPEGMGINSLFTNSINTISSVTGLGLGFSAVGKISNANHNSDKSYLTRVVISFRRWIWFTGVVGVVVTIILAPMLSRWSFGNDDYTWAYVWLSVILLLRAVSEGQTSLLRGLRCVREMAKASMWGSFMGLVISLPLYYLYGINGIVPALIIAAVVALILSWNYARKIHIDHINVTVKESFTEGLDIAHLGLMMVLSSFIGNGCTYLISIFVSHTGSVSDVGLYQAGAMISTYYVSLIFTAMSVDFYPKLAAIKDNNSQIKVFTNQQSEIMVMIATPMAVGMIIAAPIIVRLLFSQEFMTIVPYIQWAAVGMIFKTVAWSMRFIILAKAENKLFLFTEISLHILTLLLSVAGYVVYGVTGMGIAFTIVQILYLFIVLYMSHKKYQYSLDSVFVKPMIIMLSMSVVTLAVCLLLGVWGYICGAVLLTASIYYTFVELDKRLNIKEIITKYTKR